MMNIRERLLSKASLIIVMAVALFLHPAVPAALAIVDARQSDANQLKAKPLPEPAAEHLAKERGISLVEAEQRIEWQGRALALSIYLRQNLAHENYGGVWIGGGDDRIKIGLVGDQKQRTTSQSTVNIKTNSLSISNAADFIPVAHSSAEMETAAESIGKNLRTLNQNTKWPIQVGIATNLNQVILELPPEQEILSEAQYAFLEDTRSQFGNMIGIDRYTKIPQPDSCNDIYCDSPLRGGVKIIGSNDSYSSDPNRNHGGGACTSGFIVRGNSGQHYVLTAGHCEEFGNGWATYNTSGLGTFKKIGPIHRNDFPEEDDVDAMIIEVRDVYNWTTRGWVYIRDGQGEGGYHGPSRNESYDITGTSVSGELVGQRVCMSGFKSGSSCGPVKQVHAQVNFSDGHPRYGLVRAEYCAQGGDSGGPVTFQGNALGIHAGSITSGCNSTKYYTGMHPIIRSMDYTIDVF